MMAGAFVLADLQAVTLPKDVDTAFKAAASEMVGATYTLVLYCGHQIVTGIKLYDFVRAAVVGQGSDQASGEDDNPYFYGRMQNCFCRADDLDHAVPNRRMKESGCSKP